MKIDKSQLNLTPLNESIKTLFADDERLAIADEVLSMARENYKRAGGIKGDGVNSPEELVLHQLNCGKSYDETIR